MKPAKKPPSKDRSKPAAPVVPVAAKAPAPQEAARAPTYDDILAIARLIESGSRFTEFRLRSGDIEVEVKRGNGAAPLGTGSEPVPKAVAEIGPRPSGSMIPGAGSAAAAAAGVTKAAEVVSTAAVAQVPSGAHLVKSPMVGTFYRAPAPDAPSFVEIGTRVKPDTIVCIIEVMKLMNSVPAGVEGVVTHILASNAEAVQFGQPLIAIEPK